MLYSLKKGNPNHEFLTKVGYVSKTNRTQKLPLIMASMDKTHTIGELFEWAKKNNIPTDTKVVISGKFDGLSLVQKTIDTNIIFTEAFNNSWTRGDQTEGERSDIYTMHMNGIQSIKGFTIGEIIMKKKTFEKKYSSANGGKYELARALVGGKLREDVPNIEVLKDIDYVKYGFYDKIDENNVPIETFSKEDQILFAIDPIPYKKMKLGELTEDILFDLYVEFGEEYDIDGLIIDVNDVKERQRLGRETTTLNPKFARAYKHKDFDDIVTTKVTEIIRYVDKFGFANPVVHIQPVKVDGIEITKVYADNEQFLSWYGIGKGCTIGVKRSGSVIPRIASVRGRSVYATKKYSVLRKECKDSKEFLKKHFDSQTTYNSWEIEITNPELYSYDDTKDIFLKLKDVENNPTVIFRRIVAFFEIIGVEGATEKTYDLLNKGGYTSLEKVLNLTITDIEALEGFGTVKATELVNNIKLMMNEASITTFLHASSLFPTMGSSKLGLLIHMIDKYKIADNYDVIGVSTEQKNKIILDCDTIDGIALISAEIFVEGILKYYSLGLHTIIEDYLHFNTVEEQEKAPSSDMFKDWHVVCTQFRDKNFEKALELNGAIVEKSFNKKVTHVIAADDYIETNKITKAMEENIPILKKSEIVVQIPVKKDDEYPAF
jgi:DNA ligase (NAD+)